jgi:beta-galactosidase
MLPMISLQMSKGGPIIAVQLENEYGSFGNDMDYKLFLKNVRISQLISSNAMSQS